MKNKQQDEQALHAAQSLHCNDPLQNTRSRIFRAPTGQSQGGIIREMIEVVEDLEDAALQEMFKPVG
jgi:hypothetical protein